MKKKKQTQKKLSDIEIKINNKIVLKGKFEYLLRGSKKILLDKSNWIEKTVMVLSFSERVMSAVMIHEEK